MLPRGTDRDRVAVLAGDHDAPFATRVRPHLVGTALAEERQPATASTALTSRYFFGTGVPPGTWRGYEGGPEGLEILVIGAPRLGENPREDGEGQRDWWTD
jgi:hypothetical protein